MDIMMDIGDTYAVLTKKQFSNWLNRFYSTKESKGLTIEEAIKLQKREK